MLIIISLENVKHFFFLTGHILFEVYIENGYGSINHTQNM